MARLKVAALQLPTMGMSLNRLEYFIKAAAKDGVRLILLGEYVLNHFFKELETLPRSMVKEQSAKHIQTLQEIAKQYGLCIAAPIVRVEGEKYYKSIALIGEQTEFFDQDILMPYEHWNERGFYANERNTRLPVFEFGGFNIALMAGFELHFNQKFDQVMQRQVDLVLLPTCSTFDSHNRWREVIKSRAFMHNCYILRANRIGDYSDGKHKWRFYGDSMIALPSGEVGDMLDDKESLLIATIDTEFVKAERDAWGFFQAAD